jgi:hypothetical protein
VTVIDPRHPLCDQTFPLLHIKNKQELVCSCLVLLAEDVERLIPLAVTNLATVRPAVFPLPLQLSSLQNLTQTFARLVGQLEREGADEATRSSQADSDDGSARARLGNIDGNAAESGLAHSGVHLSVDGGPLGEGAER